MLQNAAELVSQPPPGLTRKLHFRTAIPQLLSSRGIYIRTLSFVVIPKSPIAFVRGNG